MATDEKKFRPYIPWKTFFNLILQMEDGGLPARIDRSYLRGRSGNDQSYLISTLKSFGLIGEQGEVKDSLKSLVQEKDQRPVAVAELLRANYDEAMALEQNATQSQLDEVFREGYGLGGDTLRKAETFFLHAADYAGIKLSPHFKASRGTSSSGTTSRRSGSRKNNRRDTNDPERPPKPENKPSDTDSMRRAYFDLLSQKAAESDELNPELFDRIERLLGVMDEGSQGAEE